MQINISGISPEKRMYAFMAPDKVLEKSGFVGYLRGYFADQKTLNTSWFDLNSDLYTSAFKSDLDTVLHSLCDKGGIEILRSKGHMASFFTRLPETRLNESGREEYGLTIKTIRNTYFMRCTPVSGYYNLYMFVYERTTLENHISKAKVGICLKCSTGRELCEILDGEGIVLTRKDGEKKTLICRYVDDDQIALGMEVFNTRYIADVIQETGCTITHAKSQLNQTKQKCVLNICER